ncbi:hypothetical protein AAFF_G00191790 [Aldrovandia affinis]|uniref:Uncharacterized protein n=1 Tax=Aldrovandia affinis TaxID=143900 RepID=A0AAD7RJT7_9TELE|nr:hypothetical protein AAFF_G00191790 [Aldrovandia affinis]
MFWQLSWHSLKLQPQQCRLLKWEVKYLRHVIGPKGVAMDSDKTAAVRERPQPESGVDLPGVRRLLSALHPHFHQDSSAFTPAVSGNHSLGEEDAAHGLDQ